MIELPSPSPSSEDYHLKEMTRGEYRKRLEIELSKVYGIKATKAQIIRIRKLASRLS